MSTGIKVTLIIAIVVLIIFIVAQYLSSRNVKSLRHDGLSRRYAVREPKEVNENTKILIAFHGFNDYPWLFELYSGLTKLTDDNYLVVYPHGIYDFSYRRVYSWNAGMCCSTALKTNVDDIGFIKKLIEDVKKDYGIQTSKVDLSGFSNGGMMALKFSFENPELVDKVAVGGASMEGQVAGVERYSIPKPTNAFDLLMFNGADDIVVPTKGGKGKNPDVDFISFTQSIERVREYSDCTEMKETEFDTFTKFELLGCTDNKAIEFHLVKGLGHVWPKGFIDYKHLFNKASYGGYDEVRKFLLN